MTIITQSKYLSLDIPTDIALNIERNSPIFSHGGSMSLPINLPLSDANRRALDFPDRLDIYSTAEGSIRIIPDMPVIVIQGSWQQRATLCITGCSENAIEATLYFDESNIWSLLEDLSLPEAMAGLHFGTIPPADADLATYRRNVFNQLNQILCPDDDPYFEDLYNECLDNREFSGTITGEQWGRMLYNRTLLLEQNDFVIAPVHTEDGWLNKFNDYDLRRKKFYILQERTDFLNISVFLRLDYVLHKVFEKIGKVMTIDQTTVPDELYYEDALEIWKTICILNNTKDALYPGCIYYSSLVPEISCKEFLMAVMAQFGCTFTEQPDGTVKMIFTNKILSSIFGSELIYDNRRQISFQSVPEYNPLDDMEKQEAMDIQLVDMDSIIMPDAHSIQYQRDQYFPRLFVPNLEGLCQRTTITSLDGEDATKDKKCPLIFANIDYTYVREDQSSSHPQGTYYYPRLSNNYIERYTSSGINKMYYSSTEEGSLYKILNSAYESIRENSDKVTITKEFTTYDLLHFDFSVPYIHEGRVMWPIKLQYELRNSPSHLVTMELIASRKS